MTRDPAPLVPWWRSFMIGLFIAALAWRAIVLSRLADGPLLTWLAADAAAFWAWAGEIRSGQWIGSEPFFLGPLYPYWLAVVRELLGDQVPRVIWLQAVLGSITVLLIADATRRIATPRAGACVGVFLAGYGMAVFFDVQILMECLVLFLGSLALWAIVRNGRHATLLVGTIVGLMALGRPTFLLLLPLYARYALRGAGRAGLVTLGRVLVVPMVLVGLTVIHHWRVDQSWIPITYSGGYNFYVGNGPPANGTFVPFSNVVDSDASRVAAGGTAEDGRSYLRQTQGLQLSAGESARYWWRAAAQHVADHPLRALYLLALKVALLFNHREVSQITDARAYERAVGALGWPLEIAFVLLAVGAMLGVPVAWRFWGPARLVIGWLALLVVGAAAFFVVDRYRIHLVPAMAILAGLGIERVVAAWTHRSRREFLVMAGATIAVVLFCWAPLIPHDPARVEWTHATMLGNAWLVSNEPRRALPYYEQASALDRSNRLAGSDTPSGRRARAALYENLGIAQVLAGDTAAALASLEMATRLAPDAVPTRIRYAEQLAMSGRWRTAREHYQAAGLTVRQAAERLVRDATIHERSGDLGATRRCLEAAAGLDPSYEPAIIPLIRLDIMNGELNAATARLMAAEQSGIDSFVVRAHLAWVRATAGDTAAARSIIESIPIRLRTTHPGVAAALEAASLNH